MTFREYLKERLQNTSITTFYKIAIVLFSIKIIGDGYSMIVTFGFLNLGSKLSTIVSFMLNFVWLGVIYYFYRNMPDLNAREIPEEELEKEIERLGGKDGKNF